MEFFGDVVRWLVDPANWSGSDGIPTRLGEHLVLSVVPLVLAVLVALPIGAWIGHTGRFANLAINVANVGRAIPSLAILALVAMLLQGFIVSIGLRSIASEVATMVALFALAIPPILTNTFIGISEVDDQLVEAGRGMGMRDSQVLWRIEIPVGLPVILVGRSDGGRAGGGHGDPRCGGGHRRTRSLHHRWHRPEGRPGGLCRSVDRCRPLDRHRADLHGHRAARNLARPPGHVDRRRRLDPDRRARRNLTLSVAGGVGTPRGVIWLTHGVFYTLARRMPPVRLTAPHDRIKEEIPTMRIHRKLALGAATLALVLSACAPGEGGSSSSASAAATGGEGVSITIGSAGFYEAQLMAEIYAQALEANGYTVERKLGIGPRDTVQPAFEAGEFDLQPEYIGSLVTFLGGEASGDPEETAAALQAALDEVGLTALDYAPAQDQNAFVVRQETADELGVSTMSELAEAAGVGDLVWGLPPECETNALCAGALEEYGFTFADLEIDPYGACDAPVATALNDGVVDVAELCSTQPDIERFNFVVLEDDLQTQPSENIAPIVSSEWLASAPDGFADILNEVSAAMDTETLTSLGVRVAVDQESIEDVAESWLSDNGLN